MPADLAGKFVVVVTLMGLIGAKLYFILETPWESRGGFLHLLAETSGVSWLGGLIAGTGALCILSATNRLPLLTLFDMAAPIGALAYGIGRIGCLMAGDGDYGRPTSLPWGMTFPRGIVPAFEPVHPTPIYEAMFGALLFFLLWHLWNERRRPGFLAAIYLILSGGARFLVEFIKLNPRLYFGFTNPQVISVLSVIAGLGLLAWSIRTAGLPGTANSAARETHEVRIDW